MKNLNFDDGNITLYIQGDPSRSFSFNPANTKMYEGFQHIIAESEKELLAIDERNKTKKDATEDEEIDAYVKASNEADKFLRKELDNTFGKGTSNLIFGEQNVCSLASNGDFIFSNFLMALVPHFKAAAEEREKKLKDQIATAKKEVAEELPEKIIEEDTKLKAEEKENVDTDTSEELKD